jgi:hypothetical protein
MKLFFIRILIQIRTMMPVMMSRLQTLYYRARQFRVLRIRVITLVVPILVFFVLFYSVFRLSANIPMKPVSSEPYILKFEDKQIEEFQKAAMKLDHKDLSVSLYEIKKGDNLWGVAKTNNHIGIETIVGVNPYFKDLLARTHQKILIVDKKGTFHIFRTGDNLPKISELYNIPLNDIRKSNHIGLFTRIRPGDILFIPGGTPKMLTESMQTFFAKRRIFICPAVGKYTSGFGWREDPINHGHSFHPGLDIRAAYGSLVCAAGDGYVTCAGWVSGYGNCVMIQHANGYVTLYGHNSKIITRVGAKVFKGQGIARVGNTGRTTATHLHFGVIKNGKPDDPASYIW